MKPGYLIGAVAVAAVVVLVLSFYWRYETAEPASEPVPVPTQDTPGKKAEPEPAPLPDIEETPPSPEPVVPELVLPDLNDSDEFVRERFVDSTLPVDWLDHEDLLRRIAVVVENATRGEIPRRQLGFLAPEGKFQVVELGEQIFLDPRA